MNRRSVVVITFDALSTAALGPYGCSWLSTPGLNRFASGSIIFDRMYASSTEPHLVLSDYLACGDQSIAKSASLRGMPTLFFTDTRQVIELPGVQDFDQCTLVESVKDTNDHEDVSEDVEDTSMGRLLAAAFARRETLGHANELLWIHFGSLSSNWDAPLEFRETDDLDPDLLQDTGNIEGQELRDALYAREPKNIRLSKENDPDLLIAWMAAYGAQVRLVDSLLDVAMKTLFDDRQAVVIVAATSGFNLGENGWIGADGGYPRSPKLHLPIMIRVPGHQPLRCGRPVLSSRLGMTLLELVNEGEATVPGSLMEETVPERWTEELDMVSPILHIRDDAGAALGREEKLAVSPGWFYAATSDGSEELYLKPDDRHDVNDIATLRPEILEAFRIG